MSLQLNKNSYDKLIEDDIKWLLKQQKTLERDHIKRVLEFSSNSLYFGNINNNPEKINIDDGDIIVLKNMEITSENSESFKNNLNNISKRFFKLFRKRIQFFVLKKNQNLEVLNEKEMEKIGWIRKKKD